MKATPLCLFWNLWKDVYQRSFEDFDLMDHAILQFLYMFLVCVRLYFGFTTLSLFNFIYWLSCKQGKGVVFVYPSLSWLIQIMYTFGCPFGAFSKVAFTYQQIFVYIDIDINIDVLLSIPVIQKGLNNQYT